MKQPKIKDLKSDTVKSAAVIAFLSAAVALIQFLGVYEVVSADFVAKTGKAYPFAVIVLSYLVALFRKNQKTQL